MADLHPARSELAAALFHALGEGRAVVARANVDLGWCPCGNTLAGECECPTAWRDGCLEGLVPVMTRGKRPA